MSDQTKLCAEAPVLSFRDGKALAGCVCHQEDRQRWFELKQSGILMDRAEIDTCIASSSMTPSEKKAWLVIFDKLAELRERLGKMAEAIVLFNELNAIDKETGDGWKHEEKANDLHDQERPTSKRMNEQ